MVPPRRQLTLSGLGIGSHVLAGLLPFVSSGAIGRLGLFPGVAALYLVGSLVLVAGLVHRGVRRGLAIETRLVLARAERSRLLLGLAGFALAGGAYYVGLARSSRVAEYVFLTRLDWLIQAPLAILLLKEPWTSRGLAGGALALSGGVVLAWTGAVGASGVVAAAIYIAASLVGYSMFRDLSAGRGASRAFALTAWRHWINTAGFTVLALSAGGVASNPGTGGVGLAALAGILIVVLFLLRFTALTGLPLWVLAAQGPTQALVAVVVTLATGGSFAPVTLVAIALVVTGEVLVTGQLPQASDGRAATDSKLRRP